MSSHQKVGQFERENQGLPSCIQNNLENYSYTFQNTKWWNSSKIAPRETPTVKV